MEKIIVHKLIAMLFIALAMLIVVLPSLVTISIKHSNIVEAWVLITELIILLGIIVFTKKVQKMYFLLVLTIVLSAMINISYTYWLQSDYFPKKLLNSPLHSKATKPTWFK